MWISIFMLINVVACGSFELINNFSSEIGINASAYSYIYQAQAGVRFSSSFEYGISNLCSMLAEINIEHVSLSNAGFAIGESLDAKKFIGFHIDDKESISSQRDIIFDSISKAFDEKKYSHDGVYRESDRPFVSLPKNSSGAQPEIYKDRLGGVARATGIGISPLNEPKINDLACTVHYMSHLYDRLNTSLAIGVCCEYNRKSLSINNKIHDAIV
ncbi:MAG: hypothetical protein KAH32_06250, partial [Chlamydiia bacterium]|nr:hypothetical protein [Chlamydiia bacterium]